MSSKKLTILINANLSFFVFLLVLTAAILRFSWAEPSNTVQVGLLAGDLGTEQHRLVLAAYEQVLSEEGFPYRILSAGDVTALGAAGLKKQFAALIIPEHMNSNLAEENAGEIISYVRENGGFVLLALNPASRDAQMSFYPVPLLADLAGVKYALPPPGGQNPTYTGGWYFPSPEQGREWGITPGKLNNENAVSGYSYGKLKFEHTWAVNVDAGVDAFDSTDWGQVPVITEKGYESGGMAIYINMPLGRHKLRSDDLTLRSVLRTFLIKKVKLPRLVNTPGGTGGMVFNLHVCSGAYNRALMVMAMQGLFQKELPFSIHITSGPDTYRLGDGMGFFAENEYRGKPVLEVLQNYGEIGSHGGWMHNFFAENMQNLPRNRVFEMLKWNSQALETITGRKVVEYSSPAGEHPFWINRYLEEMGVKAYYYAGDSGSSPSHPRIEKESAGGKVWSFPISPYLEYAALEEMERGRVPIDNVKQWYQDMVDFAADERVIRLIYTHPTDSPYGLEALRTLQEKILSEQRKGRISLEPMSKFADFLNRYTMTSFKVKRNGGNYSIDLENPEGLNDITVAVYIGEGQRNVVMGGNVKTAEENGWLYLTVTSDDIRKHLEVYQF